MSNMIQTDEYIELDQPFPGEPPFMKKGSFPALLRFHKFKASVEPGDYWFAEALLFTLFRSEEKLEERVEKAAGDGYISLSEQIQAVKSLVIEDLENTEDARYMVQEALNNNDDVGAEMDAAGEQENEDCDLKELVMHPEYQHLDLSEFVCVEKTSKTEKSYRPIKIDDINLLRKSTREIYIKGKY